MQYKNTALHWAVNTKSWRIVKVLLDAGAICLWKNIDGEGPLHWSCDLNLGKVTRLLLEKDTKFKAASYVRKVGLLQQMIGSLVFCRTDHSSLLCRTVSPPCSWQ